VRRRFGQFFAILVGVLMLAVSTSGVAYAWPSSGTVTVYGLANCNTGVKQAARKVRFQAGTGEARDGTVNNLAGGYVSVTFKNVPSGGTPLNAYVYCGFPDNAQSPARWGRQFRLTRPAVGDRQYVNLSR
jgi:hypothetical protein